MRGVALVVPLLVACEHTLGVMPVSISDAPPPPSCNATRSTCAQITPAPFFCADFDELAPVIYEAGLATALPTPDPNVRIDRRAPAVSAPCALWIDSSGDTYYIDHTPSLPPNVVDIRATLSVQVGRFADGAAKTNVVEIGVRDPAGNVFDHCYTSVEIETAGNSAGYLSMETHCGVGTQYGQVALSTALPLDWVQIAIELDMRVGVATVTLGAMTPATLMLPATSTTGGTPHFGFGVSDAAPTLGPEVAYDDIVVVTTP